MTEKGIFQVANKLLCAAPVQRPLSGNRRVGRDDRLWGVARTRCAGVACAVRLIFDKMGAPELSAA